MKEYEAKSAEELRWEDYLGSFGRRLGKSFVIEVSEDEVKKSKGAADHGPKPEIEAEKKKSVEK